MSLLSRLAAIVLLAPSLAFGASSGYPLEDIDTDHSNLPSLQRGAALFMNYCVGCHSLQYQRHVRTANDLGIPEDLYEANLIFNGSDIGSHITNAMPDEDAKAWFGGPPPDLTMVTRVRGADWVYTYLLTYYLDPSRPFGVNNEVLANTAMPHVLANLQGTPVKTCKQVPRSGGDGDPERDPLEPNKTLTEEQCGFIEVLEGTGRMSPETFRASMFDLTNFLDYVAEPYRQDRQRLGVYVLLFLVILFVFTWLLAREYRKEVH